MNDCTESLRMAVKQAFQAQQPLSIMAGDTKAFLGHLVTDGRPLDVSSHRGIVNYQPGELTITARAGTPLVELQATLAEQSQMLAFEPPAFGPAATIGGVIAAGLSGPARPWTGAARDFVLGCRIINGRGQVLRFGGEVMKNVAGYDLSRLMAGAWGTLGVLLDVSLKVLPIPRARITLMHEGDAGQAIDRFSRWGAKPWPITAAWWEQGCSHIRLAGSESAIKSAHKALGGEIRTDSTDFWADIREHTHPFFSGERPLWRVAVAPATPPLDIDGETAIDWGGAQRWLRTQTDEKTLRDAVAAVGGHATCYRGNSETRFHPLPDALMALQQRLKNALDPKGILNPGRIYPAL